ncbi:MAG TPA: hypothetical protein VHA80_11335 [Solirubrobacterales bacterium]|nr:hypothetical protein [Solirubrobacterales bacterium]
MTAVVITRTGSDPRGGADRDFTVIDRATGMPTHAIAVVCFGDRLAGVGILEKGAAVARLRSRFKVSGLAEIAPDLGLEELVDATPFRFRRHIGYRALPERTAREVLAALRDLRPGLCEPLARFQEQLRAR